MAYDELLADRIRNIFREKKVIAEEKKMMGGLGFMVDDKLCIGIYKEELMARVEPEKVSILLEKQGVRQMIHGGRPMKGYLNIAGEGFDLEADLDFWIQKCLDFNPNAKSSKKAKK